MTLSPCSVCAFNVVNKQYMLHNKTNKIYWATQKRCSHATLLIIHPEEQPRLGLADVDPGFLGHYRSLCLVFYLSGIFLASLLLTSRHWGHDLCNCPDVKLSFSFYRTVYVLLFCVLFTLSPLGIAHVDVGHWGHDLCQTAHDLFLIEQIFPSCYDTLSSAVLRIRDDLIPYPRSG
jgi:hypothetical protein